jgi:hypothetical protein
MQRFDIRKLKNAEVKGQYWVKTSNTPAALENLVMDYVDINRDWKNIRQDIKISSKESRTL